MKVMLSYPPLPGAGSAMLTQNRQFQWYHVPAYIFPVVPAQAATLLAHAGFDVLWNDCIVEQWTYDRFLHFFEAERPDLIAFETKTPVVKMHWDLINELKRINPACQIALMGDHVTALPEESLLNCRVDYVLTGGHYDALILSLARTLRDGETLEKGIWFRDGETLKNTGPFASHRDLNALPFIDRDLTQAPLYYEKWKKRTPFFYTMAGRDCAWDCSFCSWTTIYPTFSVRQPENLLDEIGMLIERHGVREIFDDTGNFPTGRWLKTFCQGMIERGYHKEILLSCNMRFDRLKPDVAEMMKKAGFRKVKSGLESANQKTLDWLNKESTVQDIVEGSRHAKRAGLEVHLTIMMGYPWETREEARNTVRLARELMGEGAAEMLQATILMPYPGTPLYRLAVENGWFAIDPTDYNRFGMTEPVLITPDMEPAEVMAFCQELYKAFFSPRFMLTQVAKGFTSAENFSYMLRGAKSVIGHLMDFGRRESSREQEHSR